MKHVISNVKNNLFKDDYEIIYSILLNWVCLYMYTATLIKDGEFRAEPFVHSSGHKKTSLTYTSKSDAISKREQSARKAAASRKRAIVTLRDYYASSSRRSIRYFPLIS